MFPVSESPSNVALKVAGKPMISRVELRVTLEKSTPPIMAPWAAALPTNVVRIARGMATEIFMLGKVSACRTTADNEGPLIPRTRAVFVGFGWWI